MPQVTKSLSQNIEVLSANGLSTFVDDTDGLLKIKDTNGIVQPITDYTGGGSGGGVAGSLRTYNCLPLTSSLTCISDSCGNISPLLMSTCAISNYGTGGISSNVVFGDGNLPVNVSGNTLSIFGNNALFCNTTGANNVAIE
jgi:hypothetical protein